MHASCSKTDPWFWMVLFKTSGGFSLPGATNFPPWCKKSYQWPLSPLRPSKNLYMHVRSRNLLAVENESCWQALAGVHCQLLCSSGQNLHYQFTVIFNLTIKVHFLQGALEYQMTSSMQRHLNFPLKKQYQNCCRLCQNRHFYLVLLWTSRNTCIGDQNLLANSWWLSGVIWSADFVRTDTRQLTAGILSPYMRCGCMRTTRVVDSFCEHFLFS